MIDAAPQFYPDDVDLEAPLRESAAEVYVGRTAFKTGPPSRVGVELEWLVYDAHTPAVPVPVQRVRAALEGFAAAARPVGPPPAGHPAVDLAVDAAAVHGRLTTEPGGQLELSSPPAPLPDCLRQTAAELAVLRRCLADAGLTLVGLGMDPLRPPLRQTDEPRYVAMERHFDRRGRSGRLMMCSTASVQVCLDAGADDADVVARWQALHAFAPVLVALFANSPLREGHPTGWRCSRQAVWSQIDPSRTRPPADVDPHRARPHPADPRAAYARYALDAEVLAIRRPDRPWDAPAGLTFRDWLRGRGPGYLGRPRLDDLEYHLSTLFPPVRPRGHLELRVIDAQPGDRWQLVAAVVATLLDDPAARDAALAAVEPVTLGAGAAQTAARCGMADPALARAGVAVLAAAATGMRRSGLPAALADGAERFADRFPARLRSPADDLLDGWTPARPHLVEARSAGVPADSGDSAGPDPPRPASGRHSPLGAGRAAGRTATAAGRRPAGAVSGPPAGTQRAGAGPAGQADVRPRPGGGHTPAEPPRAPSPAEPS